LIFAPFLSVLPLFGFCEMTRPFFARLEDFLLIFPTRQWRFVIFAFAFANFWPTTFGTCVFGRRASRWNDKTNYGLAVAEAAPLWITIEDADNSLLRLSWPRETRADVKALVRAEAVLVRDLQTVGLAADLSPRGDWANQFSHDAARAHAAVNIVRADLGLPSSKQ
jgi:hypothetical protein